jgi:hypothetical protein
MPKVNVFEMPDRKSVPYFNCSENLEKIKRTNGLGPATLLLDDKKTVSVTSSVIKSSKRLKASDMWFHYCDKINHNMADCGAISRFKQQKKAKFEAL